MIRSTNKYWAIINKTTFSNNLWISTTPEVAKKKEDWLLKKRIVKQFKNYVIPFMHNDRNITYVILKSYFYLILSKLCFFGGPILLKNGINAINTGFGDPLLLFLGYGICYSSSVLFESFRNVQITKIANAALKQTSQKAYRHFLSLGPDFFFGSSQRQKLFSIYKAQTAIEQNLKSFTQYFLPISLDISISCVLLLKYYGSTFLISFLASYTIYAVFTIKYSDYRRKGVKLQKNAEKDIDFVTSETFANYYNVKYYSAQQYQINRYLKSLSNFYLHSLNNQKTLGNLNTTQRIVFGSGLTFNMILAAHYAKQGLMSTGQIIMIQTLMLQLINPLFFLGSMYRSITDTYVDVKQLFKIMDTKPNIVQIQNAVECNQLDGRIQFKNVTFKYDKQQYNIIQNVNFDIKSKEFVVLMGPSGTGKTSIFNLIFRLYDVKEGAIFIDGINIKDIKLESFRKQFAFVSQSPYLFNDTIMNNILYANPNANKEEVYELTKALGLHDYIVSLPKGYDTEVGEKGSIFSGGQKQRISLIRALVQKKKLILLDEPTSSLDSNMQNIIGNLLKSYTECTRIMITHRESLANFADRIIHLQKKIPNNSNGK